MKKFHEVKSVNFEDEFLVLSVDGKTYRISIADASERLARSSGAQRRFFRVSPSGYGIHWPEIDEDLSIDGLIDLTKAYRTKSSNAVLREGHNE